MDIIEKIIKNEYKNISNSSLEAYKQNIKKTLDILGTNKISQLMNYDNVLNKLKEQNYSNSTLKNKLSSIVLFLKSLKKVEDFFDININDNIIDKYTILIDGLNRKMDIEYKKMDKSNKDSKNWVDYEELKKYIEGLKEKIPKKINSFYDINKYQKYIIGYCQLELALRNELSDTDIYKNDKDIKNKENNYIILDDNKSIMYINKYKTKKTYGTIKIVLSDDLAFELKKYYNVLQDYKNKNNIKNNSLLFDKNGNYYTRNNFTHFLNSIFKDLNKNVSSTIIRKSYLSHKYDADDMIKTSRALGHSIATELKYYIKK
jgi:integrase